MSMTVNTNTQNTATQKTVSEPAWWLARWEELDPRICYVARWVGLAVLMVASLVPRIVFGMTVAGALWVIALMGLGAAMGDGLLAVHEQALMAWLSIMLGCGAIVGLMVAIVQKAYPSRPKRHAERSVWECAPAETRARRVVAKALVARHAGGSLNQLSMGLEGEMHVSYIRSSGLHTSVSDQLSGRVADLAVIITGEISSLMWPGSNQHDPGFSEKTNRVLDEITLRGAVSEEPLYANRAEVMKHAMQLAKSARAEAVSQAGSEANLERRLYSMERELRLRGVMSQQRFEQLLNSGSSVASEKSHEVSQNESAAIG